MTFFAFSDLQPEPEQQAQCLQVHHRQQKLPPVPRQSSHAPPGREPRPAQDAHHLRPVPSRGEQPEIWRGAALALRGPGLPHPPAEPE